MTKTKAMNKYLLIAIAAILSLGSGFLGYKLKKCPEIIPVKAETIVRIDSIPVPVIEYRTIPVSTPFTKSPKNYPTIISVHDTLYQDRIVLDQAGFYSVDTLTYQGLKIAITDTGGCYGITSRSTQFSGTLPERVVTHTITNNIVRPAPLVTIYAGALGQFNKDFNGFDFGPSLGITIRNRHRADYSYQLNSGSHSITLSTKLR